jgi:hypothetical protein
MASSEVIVMDVSELRSEHDAVLAAISSRRSTLHLAHGAVSAIVAFVFLAASAKLWWDFSEYEPEYYQAALGVTGVALLYSVVRFLIGRVDFKKERIQLARLRVLRRELGVDDHSALLLPR